MKKNNNFKLYQRINLPMPYINDETDTIEYIYKDSRYNQEFQIYHNIINALEDFTYASLYYPYNLEKTRYHAHDFEELINHLYNYPQSFNISDEDKEFYSIQELRFIKRTQNYLKLIEVQDLNNYENRMKKYTNEKQKKYQGAYPIKFSDKDINQTFSKTRLFTVHKYSPEYSKEETYLSNENKALVIDEKDNYRFLIEFTNTQIKKYKDIKHLYECDDYLDEDKVEIKNFKVLETFEKDK